MEEDFFLAGSNLAADQKPVLKPHQPIVHLMPTGSTEAHDAARSGQKKKIGLI